MDTTRRALRCCAAGIVVVSMMVGAAGCAATKADYVEEVDALCAKLNKKLTGELSYGDGFGLDDVGTLTERMDLVRKLSKDVKTLDRPEGIPKPDGWLTEVDSYVKYATEVQDTVEDAQPGSDAAISMTLGAFDSHADEVGKAAKKYGFTTCADINDWRVFPD